MSFSKEFGQGINAYAEANRVLFKYGLYKYLVIPGIVTIIYAGLYFFAAFKIAGTIPSEASDYPWWLSWLGSAAEWVVRVVFWPVAVAVFLFSYKTIAQIILSPILSQLSEQVEHLVFDGPPIKTGWAEALSDIQRAIFINFRNLFHEILYCLLVGFVPVLGSILAFGISSYYAGFNFMDFAMERHRMSVSQSVKFVHRHRGLAAGLGFVAMLSIFGTGLAMMASTLEVYRLTGPRLGNEAAAR